MKNIIPLVDLKAQYKNLKSEIDTAISNVINHSGFIQGEEVKGFETEFARFNQSKFCVGVNSGTDALLLGIRALGLKGGDEVIIPANTFFSTAICASLNGLKPVFVDIDEEDFGINLNDLSSKITKKTKAVMAVHLYGQPDKLDEIKKIIKRTGEKIYLLEDACQAHGAKYKGKRVGNFGTFSAFSFYPGKNLGAYGDGGAIITNNGALNKKLKLLREYGQGKKYYHDLIGINSRLDTIHAAVLKIKLKYLDKSNRKRQNIASLYSSLLKDLPVVRPPKSFTERESVFHLYVIRTKKRDKLIKYLNSCGIQALIHYPIPLHLQKAFKSLGYRKGSLPVVEKISNEILSLPIYPELSQDRIEYIILKIKKFFKK